MATARPTSIGDARSGGYALVKEQYDLPSSHPLIAAEVERILGLGLIQKLVLEVGEPIRVFRFVKRDPNEPPLEEIELKDLYNAARNTNMENFHFSGDPMRTIFEALAFMRRGEAIPKAFLCNNYNAVRRWLELPYNFYVQHIFEVALFEEAEIPEDSLLLIGRDPADEEVVTISYRIAMDPPKKKEKAK